MVERVRLVIWDLDETFWHGTVTEGGHRYRRDTHDIVIELAKRGIMSSICSKNDMATVQAILQSEGIWDYFIFPSVDWSPKGTRIRDMIEVIGLRPPTVMFVDDNPMNLNEALHYVPDIQVESHEFIPRMLSDGRFLGKDDSKLSRLAQYKVLERRREDEKAAGADNTEFLRSSGLKVTIVHEIEQHLDRVVELINRTNQLNFTKNRLPEEPEEAKRAVLSLFSAFMNQTGLVHVQDRYGDYGYCGLYVMNAVTHELVHFCFSCRILNMGVERWLYEKLGRPRLDVRGEVLTDLFATTPAIDWINTDISESGSSTRTESSRIGNALIRGGCEMQVVAHYLGIHADTVHGEYFQIRSGLPIRIDHSCFIPYLLNGLNPESVNRLTPLGYVAEDFHSEAVSKSSKFDLYVFNFGQDHQAVYRDRTSGIVVPFEIPGNDNALSAFNLAPEVVAQRLKDPFAREALEYLRENFEFLGPTSSETFKSNVRMLLDHVHPKPVFILLQKESWKDADGVTRPIPHHVRANESLKQAAADHVNVAFLRPEDHIADPSEDYDGVHFKRQVYFRIAQTILQTLQQRSLSKAELTSEATGLAAE